MNQKDKESLTLLLNKTKDVYQNISRHVHWTASDSEYLDDLMHREKLQKDIESRMVRNNLPRYLASSIPQFLIYKSWQRTKAVYSFNREIVDAMAQTADTSLYTSLLDKLPFKDMLFFFPVGVLPKYNGEETAGIYVHIERHPEHVWIVISFLDRDKNLEIFPGINFAFPITNGTKVSQVFETPQYKKCLENFKRTVKLNFNMDEEAAEQRMLSEQKALNIAINLMYYLSSQNADIKAIKKHKKGRKASSNPNANNALSINYHEVGTDYAEIVYRRLSVAKGVDEDNVDRNSEDVISQTEVNVQIEKIAKKRRPHARRAHWQHYWTGKGRTTLEVRWISDLFVGASRDDQATIVYDTAKPSKKGKRNPNTSKKKRNQKE